jgi:hypothetical protein
LSPPDNEGGDDYGNISNSGGFFAKLKVAMEEERARIEAEVATLQQHGGGKDGKGGGAVTPSPLIVKNICIAIVIIVDRHHQFHRLYHHLHHHHLHHHDHQEGGQELEE